MTDFELMLLAVGLLILNYGWFRIAWEVNNNVGG